MYPVYCHMSSLSAKCVGGGWTLVMKLDGNKVRHVIVNSLVNYNYASFVFSSDTGSPGDHCPCLM